MVAPAPACLAALQRAAGLRLEVRVNPRAGLRTGLFFARGALGAPQARRAAVDEDREDALLESQAAPATRRFETPRAGDSRPVAVTFCRLLCSRRVSLPPTDRRTRPLDTVRRETRAKKREDLCKTRSWTGSLTPAAVYRSNNYGNRASVYGVLGNP
jgi:hypothetical protein